MPLPITKVKQVEFDKTVAGLKRHTYVQLEQEMEEEFPGAHFLDREGTKFLGIHRCRIHENCDTYAYQLTRGFTCCCSNQPYQEMRDQRESMKRHRARRIQREFQQQLKLAKIYTKPSISQPKT